MSIKKYTLPIFLGCLSGLYACETGYTYLDVANSFFKNEYSIKIKNTEGETSFNFCKKIPSYPSPHPSHIKIMHEGEWLAFFDNPYIYEKKTVIPNFFLNQEIFEKISKKESALDVLCFEIPIIGIRTYLRDSNLVIEPSILIQTNAYGDEYIKKTCAEACNILTEIIEG